jgi:hypothetical protein
VQAYKNATVVATTPYPRPSRKNARKMGVLDSKGKVVRASQLWRSYGRMGFPPDVPASSRDDSREVIYAGHLPPHFGHFLLEGLSRLWFAAQHPEIPIVWSVLSHYSVHAYTRWQREMLDVVGIRNEPIFVLEPRRFSRVHVPQAGFRIKDFFSTQLADFLAVWPGRPRDPAQKIWLSRAGVEAQHGSVYVARLDEQLAEHGWSVIHPERLPISKQLDLLASASQIAAEEGSALHLLILLADVTGLQVDILTRRPDRPAERQNANYGTIAATRGFTQRLHVIPEERVLGEGYGHVTKVATTLAGHLEALGVPPRPDLPAQQPPRPAAALAGAMTADADSYLELGPARDGLYPSVEAARRDIVRTAFAFDPRRATGEGLALYEMPFSEYFEYCVEPDTRYDVIVLDGLASGAELDRWFEASRAVAHDGTTWLILAAAGVLDGATGLASSRLRSRRVMNADGPAQVVLGASAPESQLDATEAATR